MKIKNSVQDLINKLSEINDKTLEVHLEGCDCWQDWNGKISIKSDNYLLLENNEKQ